MTGAADVELMETRAGVLLRVRVKPRGRKNAVEGVRAGAILICVTAPPAEGAANAAVINVLADFLDRAPNTLIIARGHKAREKTVLATGADAGAVRERLQQLQT